MLRMKYKRAYLWKCSNTDAQSQLYSLQLFLTLLQELMTPQLSEKNRFYAVFLPLEPF